MKAPFRALPALLAGPFLVSAASADIVGFDANVVHVVARPVNQRYGPNAYNTPKVQIWNEQQGVVLPRNVPVDIVKDGTYAALNELGNFWIPAGTKVDSHYLYFDPSRKEGVETTVTFSGRILGVVIESDRMREDRFLESDGFILPAVPKKNVPRSHFNLRGLELRISRNIILKGRGDDFVSVRGNAITVHVKATSPGDQIRVITQSVH